VVKRIAVLCVVAACGSFQSPDVVVDIRVLAMAADKPDQVVTVDLANPSPAALLGQLQPATVCALVADPGNMRRLAWSMTLCPFTSNERCNTDDTNEVIGSGFEDDPDVTTPEPSMCATVQPDAALLSVVQDELDSDDFHGLDGLDYMVSLRVGGEGGDPALDLFAAKALQVSPDDPVGRTPNQNPSIEHMDEIVNDGEPVVMALGRCVDQAAPLVVNAGDTVELTPIVGSGAAETYTVPTIDGKVATFTESLTYQWTATYGSFDNDFTGGPRDEAGNVAPILTDWVAPDDTEISAATDVTIWMVQRDERLGVQWYEMCVRVMP
jgi:hypothetical protein